jgi:hypothetical protein
MTGNSTPDADPAHLLRDAYEAFAGVVAGLGDEESWRPTGCTGWAVRDLVFHCLSDAQRGLVALHTPAAGPVDRDAVTYWRDWRPDSVGAANGRRWVRVSAGMFLDFSQLRDLYQETVAATVTAAAAADPARPVGTQGHVLTTADLLATLAVEASPSPCPRLPDRPLRDWRWSAPSSTVSSAVPSRSTGPTSTTPAPPPAACP